MKDDASPPTAPRAWVDAIEAGMADIKAGRTFDFEEVLAEFEREDAAETEAETATAGLQQSRANA